MTKNLYNQKFYEKQQPGSIQSAHVVIPTILNWIAPKSVVDVGCGVGSWLSVFDECGVRDYLGIDGEYVDKNLLLIPQSKFKPFDLKQPIQLEREFDLVVSLEVAEHLPAENAEKFIQSLTALGPVILFSAAIPFQGGTGHINEQWPEYWKAYFDKYGYVLCDAIRSKIWNDRGVDPWYRQNIFLYVRENCLDKYPQLKKELEGKKSLPLALVHPETYLYNIERLDPETNRHKE